MSEEVSSGFSSTAGFVGGLRVVGLVVSEVATLTPGAEVVRAIALWGNRGWGAEEEA